MELFVKYLTAVKSQPQILDTRSELWSQRDNTRHNSVPEEDTMWRKFWASHCLTSTRRSYGDFCASLPVPWLPASDLNKKKNHNFIYLALFKINCKAFCIEFYKTTRAQHKMNYKQTITFLKSQSKVSTFFFFFNRCSEEDKLLWAPPAGHPTSRKEKSPLVWRVDWPGDDLSLCQGLTGSLRVLKSVLNLVWQPVKGFQKECGVLSPVGPR